MSSPNAPTSRSKLGRHPERGTHELEEIFAVIDAGFLCHIEYAIDGQPYVTPTAYWREGEQRK